jgi:hypothetical protein
LEAQIQDIKEKNVAAAIFMETQSLTKEEKDTLKRLVEQDKIEVKKVSLRSLEFNEETKQFLRLFYEESKVEGVFLHYKKVVRKLCNSYEPGNLYISQYDW